ncbi:MAG: hypothetical protein ACYC6B_08650 [Thermoleophilia bacterium]
MAQLSEMNLDEWMMILSTLVALPSMVILLIVVFLGKFPSSEQERYLALLSREPDYWDESDPAPQEPCGPAAKDEVRVK